jgi:hypothetical protein
METYGCFLKRLRFLQGLSASFSAFCAERFSRLRFAVRQFFSVLYHELPYELLRAQAFDELPL